MVAEERGGYKGAGSPNTAGKLYLLLEDKVEYLGGAILIFIGVKTLWEHVQ